MNGPTTYRASHYEARPNASKHSLQGFTGFNKTTTTTRHYYYYYYDMTHVEVVEVVEVVSSFFFNDPCLTRIDPSQKAW